MSTMFWMVSDAGAFDGTLLDTAIARVSSANGNCWRLALVSLAFSEDDERAKSTSATLAGAYSRVLPAPEPFGRLTVPDTGSVIWQFCGLFVRSSHPVRGAPFWTAAPKLA